MNIIWCVTDKEVVAVWGMLIEGHDIVQCIPHPNYRCPDDYWHVSGFLDKDDAIAELHRRAKCKVAQAEKELADICIRYNLQKV